MGGLNKFTFEGMVAWALANPSPTGRVNWATGEHIREHFRVARETAVKVAREARAQHEANLAESQPADADAREGMRWEDKGPTATLCVTSPRIKTLPDALAHGEVDTEIWEVDHYEINSWEMGYRTDEGTGARLPLWQVKVWLKRRVVSSLHKALEALIERMPAERPPRHTASDRQGERMVEVALYDLHFGLLAWAPETDENYDVHIARRIMGDAMAQIIARTRKLNVERYLLPIGNDLFHVNDPTGLTPLHRNRLDVDSRLPKIIEEAGMALRDAVNALRKIAPVKLIWVPGNHDPQTSYWMLRELAAFYRSDPRVEVDTSPKPRKVEHYGVNLLWFLHGCDLAAKNEKALPGLFASEAAALWAPGQYREIHRGHTHKKQELWFTGVETYGGVVVRTIPSLVATDAWHFQKGFVETSKTAQFFVWNKVYGLESVHDVHVDKGLYATQGKKAF